MNEKNNLKTISENSSKVTEDLQEINDTYTQVKLYIHNVYRWGCHIQRKNSGITIENYLSSKFKILSW